jgi:type II secretory pathway predicted ATPase ExeA
MTREFRTDHLKTDGLRDPSLFVPRGEAMEKILDTLRNGNSPVFIEGVTGSGKTSLITVVKRRLAEDGARTAEIPFLYTKEEEFLRAVARAWGIKEKGTPLEILERLRKKLNPDRLNLLLVDEASDFLKLADPDKAALATALRSLISLERDGRRLCGVVLAGLPGLLDELGRASPTLRERLEGCHIVLGPLTWEEYQEYLRRYAEYAGLKRKWFEESGVREIYKWSKGIPRQVNMVLLSIIKAIPPRGQVRIDAGFVRKAMGVKATEVVPELQALSPHKRLVMEIIASREPDGITVPELTQELVKRGIPTSRRSVSGTCKELADMGWLVRRGERKTFRLRLSEFARRVFAKG